MVKRTIYSKHLFVTVTIKKAVHPNLPSQYKPEKKKQIGKQIPKQKVERSYACENRFNLRLLIANKDEQEEDWLCKD